jgi:hypothetical protein
VDVVARAFRLNDNSCGPDCFTVMAAVTMASAADSNHLLSETWLALARRTSNHIRETTLRPADFNTPVDAKLSKLQQRVLEYVVTAFQALNITWQPGEQTNLEDLMRAMCTGPDDIRPPYRLSTQSTRVCTSCGNKAQQPEATTHCIEITGQDVLDRNLVAEGSIYFDVQACVLESATLHGVPHVDNACPGCRSGPRKSDVKVLSLPDWLPVMFRCVLLWSVRCFYLFTSGAVLCCAVLCCAVLCCAVLCVCVCVCEHQPLKAHLQPCNSAMQT